MLAIASEAGSRLILPKQVIRTENSHLGSLTFSSLDKEKAVVSKHSSLRAGGAFEACSGGAGSASLAGRINASPISSSRPSRGAGVGAKLTSFDVGIEGVAEGRAEWCRETPANIFTFCTSAGLFGSQYWKRGACHRELTNKACRALQLAVRVSSRASLTSVKRAFRREAIAVSTRMN